MTDEKKVQAIVSLFVVYPKREVVCPAVRINGIVIDGELGQLSNPTLWKTRNKQFPDSVHCVEVQQNVIEANSFEDLRKYLYGAVDEQIKFVEKAEKLEE